MRVYVIITRPERLVVQVVSSKKAAEKICSVKSPDGTYHLFYVSEELTRI